MVYLNDGNEIEKNSHVFRLLSCSEYKITAPPPSIGEVLCQEALSVNSN